MAHSTAALQEMANSVGGVKYQTMMYGESQANNTAPNKAPAQIDQKKRLMSPFSPIEIVINLARQRQSVLMQVRRISRKIFAFVRARRRPD